METMDPNADTDGAASSDNNDDHTYEKLIELCHCTTLAIVAFTFQTEIELIVSDTEANSYEFSTFEDFQKFLVFVRELRAIVFHLRQNGDPAVYVSIASITVFRDLLPYSGSSMIQMLLKVHTLVEIIKSQWKLSLSEPPCKGLAHRMIRHMTNSGTLAREAAALRQDLKFVHALLAEFHLSGSNHETVTEIYQTYIDYIEDRMTALGQSSKRQSNNQQHWSQKRQRFE
uniref:Uncharacterized protein U2 n=1 Tax=Hyposoter didymator TaxID=260305 RepID=D7P5M0_HYPDD|nr:unknown [Hyposoter didymator]